MRSVILAGAMLAVVAATLPAQSAMSDAPRPDSTGHWEVGLYPTFRKLTYDLADKHEWSLGATANVGYRITRYAMLNAELLGGWIPQLNTISQGQVNELLPTLSLQLEYPNSSIFRPYLVLGGGHESFHFESPHVANAQNLHFWTGHVGVGFRLKLNTWAAMRTEVNEQVSGHRPSFGLFSGVSFYPFARKRAPMVVAAPPVIQHMTDTLRMTDTLMRTDTVRMTSRVREQFSDTVLKTVKGENVILVLRDANFDVGKSELRSAARLTLDSLARELTTGAAKSVAITITGYTDNTGSDDLNMKLGLARAESVKSYLVAHGVEDSRMETASKGKADPVATNATAVGRQLNRRVVIGRQ